MAWRDRSLSVRLGFTVLPVIALAGWGLLWIMRSAQHDAQAAISQAESIHQQAVSAAASQARDLAEAGRRFASMIDAVRSLQLSFRLQVVAFRSLLIRGARPDQRDKFQHEFDSYDTVIHRQIATLSGRLGKDDDAASLLSSFAKVHALLGKSYRNAVAMCDLAETWDEGLHRADDYMVGRDKDADAFLEQLTALLLTRSQGEMAEAVAAGKERLSAIASEGAATLQTSIATSTSRGNRLVWLAVGLLTALAVALLVVIRLRLRRLAGIVQAGEALAAGDLSVRLPVGSRDEIGRAADALNRSLGACRR